MTRSEGMYIVDALWEIASDPPAALRSGDPVDRVTELAARIQDASELSANLKMKADQVVRQLQALFETAAEGSSPAEVEIAGAMARNAVTELRLIAQRQLPTAEEKERVAAAPAAGWSRAPAVF